MYTWENGKQYIGDWKQNKMDGFGIFKWIDGKRYEGEFKND